jgi:hypothetical protein
MLAALTKLLTVLALVVGVFAFAACGESSEEKAKAQVCSAREDISKQLDILTNLTVSTSVLSEAKGSVESIAGDLKKIKEAQPNLSPGRKAQVEMAAKTFETQVTSTVSSLASGLSLTNAETEIKAAATQLANSFKNTLAPINCS